MDQIIANIKNFKIDIPKNSYRRKIDSIKARHKPVSRKIKYLSYDKEGKFVEKRGSFLDKNKLKIMNMNKPKSPVYQKLTAMDELIKLLPKSPTLKVKVCKDGYIFNTETGRCVKIKICKK